MQVIIDGVTYHPATQQTPRIGIAITTHNRPDMLKKALAAFADHSPDNSEIVVVDDGSDTPVMVPDGIKLIRNNTATGIAAAKNRCIESLFDAGCDYLFLFDDDTWPSSENWWLPYISSPEPHLMYLWGNDVYFRENGIRAHVRPKGCMLYVTRKAVDRVGGMDTEFGTWGFEHESWSDRIFSAGLTTCRYADVENSAGLFYASDEKGSVQSSVPEHVRQTAKPQLAEEKRNSSEYIPFRSGIVAGNKPGVSLSILIPSVHTRWDNFAQKIQAQIFRQYNELGKTEQDRVEILFIMDTKTIQLGDKRNEMVRLAKGKYVVFVDDDDRVEPDYITSLLAATASGADVITFHAKVSLDGNAPLLCRYSLKYAEDANTGNEYHRIPNHICAVKRSIVLRTPFPSKLCGEDREYAKDLRPLLRTEHAIDRVLYHYDYNRTTTETQLSQRYQTQIVRRSKPPVVDVVMLSKGDTEERRAMTQHAIDTCREGAGANNVNMIVIEQAENVRYAGAVTLFEGREFAYNSFANRGIKTGYAPWVMVANNDLEFMPGWLDQLLKFQHPVMSPASPGDSRQQGITKNETGTVNGKHFSGWCFMLSRQLWEKIGGLDEDFRYWCADDSVIEQVRLAGVLPMLIPTSHVKHLVSKTGGTALPDEMTWGQVHLFEQKYGIKKFENDQRYTAYKKRMGIA
ncbi:glycosyltransferase family 2 protein [Erwinia endophytica]|uniref:glycosyltransferase family 2 protein n=1 Tax=Erwinia endophytica TaxID=1563158 RepID=UPI00186BAFF0|nr:glycosyltransferase [Erwinia endophytica]